MADNVNICCGHVNQHNKTGKSTFKCSLQNLKIHLIIEPTSYMRLVFIYISLPGLRW